MSKKRTLAGLAAGALGAAVAVTGLGVGSAAASPQTPLFPEVVDKACVYEDGTRAQCVATMLDKRTTRDLREMGVPAMLGDLFDAGPAFDRALNDTAAQDCVLFGMWEDGLWIGFNHVRAGSPNFTCV